MIVFIGDQGGNVVPGMSWYLIVITKVQDLTGWVREGG